MNLFRKYKKDCIFFFILILAGLILLGGLLILNRQGSSISVTVSGEEIARFPLDEDRTYLIEGKDGGTNFLVIEDGKAWLTEASCPDGLCVHMGKIHASGQSIICLPNQVVVSVEAEASPDDPDIIVR